MRSFIMSSSRHFVSMKMTNELIVASRIYVAMCIVFWIYIFCLRMVERCALVATAVQLYRTFPHRIGPLFEFIFLSFKTSLWITLVDYFGEENCRTYYESELVGLCRMRFCNFLRCGLYFTKAEEFYACSESQRIHSFCSSRPSVHSFSETSPDASKEVGPLRDYINLLRSRTGKDVLIHFDQDSNYSEECQRIFKEINRFVRGNEIYTELFAPVKRELLAEVRICEKGVIVPGAWLMSTTDYMIVFQDLDSGASLCEVITKSGKTMYKKMFPARLYDLERMVEGLLAVVKHENFGLVSSSWHFWNMVVLHSAPFDELFEYLLSGQRVYETRLPGGQPTLVLGEKPKWRPCAGQKRRMGVF